MEQQNQKDIIYRDTRQTSKFKVLCWGGVIGSGFRWLRVEQQNRVQSKYRATKSERRNPSRYSAN